MGSDTMDPEKKTIVEYDRTADGATVTVEVDKFGGMHVTIDPAETYENGIEKSHDETEPATASMGPDKADKVATAIIEEQQPEPGD